MKAKGIHKLSLPLRTFLSVPRIPLSGEKPKLPLISQPRGKAAGTSALIGRGSEVLACMNFVVDDKIGPASE